MLVFSYSIYEVASLLLLKLNLKKHLKATINNEFFFYLCLLIIIASCNRKTEFFPLTGVGESSGQKTFQYIVIANPPENLDLLALTLEKYSKSNFDLCETKDSANLFRVFFYKETKETHRNFKNTGNDCEWGADNLDCHSDDIISILQKDLQYKNKWVFQVRKNRDADWIDYPFEIDCKD